MDNFKTDYLQNNLKVTDYCLNSAGLTISYELEGKIKHLMADPHTAVVSLCHIGYLESHAHTPGLMVTISRETPTDYEDVIMTWETFANNTSFSQYWAIRFVINYLQRQELKIMYDMQTVNPQMN